MVSRAEQNATDGYLLWNYLDVNGSTHRCKVEEALGFDYHRVGVLSRYLLRETSENVILPSGKALEPHVSALFRDECKCGTLSVNYTSRMAKNWHQRRLITLRGHANSCVEIGEQLASQFPKSVVQRRLTSDARRILDDVDIALAELDA